MYNIKVAIAFAILIAINFRLSFAEHKEKDHHPPHNPKSLVEWKALDFSWTAEFSKEEMLKDGRYIISNCAVTGVKMFQDQLFVSVPRWLPGVPATLATVDTKTGNLVPFPSWESQALASPLSESHFVSSDPIVYVQSMEIDSKGHLFVLDVGQLNLFSAPPALQLSFGVALKIYDLKLDNCLIFSYRFPTSIFNTTFGKSFANDLVIDEKRNVVYISDTTNEGGIVAFNFVTFEAKRFVHTRSMSGVPSDYIINGFTAHQERGADGIALSHDGHKLFYSTVSTDELWSIPTKVLLNFTAAGGNEIEEAFDEYAQLILPHKGLSDGLAIDKEGFLYFMNATKCSLERMRLDDRKIEVLLQDCERFNWIDTFAFDTRTKSLVFSTNRLPLFFAKQLNLDQVNFRIFSLPIHSLSYLAGNAYNHFHCLPPSSSSPSSFLSPSTVVV